MYVYIESEHNSYGSLYTVGFYDPNGKFIPESDHESEQKASDRVHYLNGGNSQKEIDAIKERLTDLETPDEPSTSMQEYYLHKARKENDHD